jgi:hypothetical protein
MVGNARGIKAHFHVCISVCSYVELGNYEADSLIINIQINICKKSSYLLHNSVLGNRSNRETEMTDSKKFATSASNPTVSSSEAKKRVNPPNAVPYKNKARSERYLYGGMLFPSRIIAQDAKQAGEQDIN